MRGAYCALRAPQPNANDEGPMRADSARTAHCMIAISARPAGNPLRLRSPPARKHPDWPLPGKAAIAADMLCRPPVTYCGQKACNILTTGRTRLAPQGRDPGALSGRGLLTVLVTATFAFPG